MMSGSSTNFEALIERASARACAPVREVIHAAIPFETKTSLLAMQPFVRVVASLLPTLPRQVHARLAQDQGVGFERGMATACGVWQMTFHMKHREAREGRRA